MSGSKSSQGVGAVEGEEEVEALVFFARVAIREKEKEEEEAAAGVLPAEEVAAAAPAADEEEADMASLELILCMCGVWCGGVVWCGISDRSFIR